MKKILFSVTALAALTALPAQGTPIRLDGTETNLQQILDTLPGGTGIDVLSDQYALDERWSIDGFFGFGQIVAEIAGYANLNAFGIYDIHNPANRLQVFSGAASQGALAVFEPTVFTSNLFGFYLDTPDGFWFSESALNSDGADHLVAYQYGSQFVLALEDLASTSWDQDYNDFVVVISGAQGVKVPEPASFGLLALGLAGIGAFGRRRKKVDA